MSETSKPEAWQRGVYIGLHHDIHFLRYAQRRVFADVPVRLGNRTYRAGGIQRVTFLKLTPMGRFCGVLDQIWFPTRGNQILLHSENALHLRSAFQPHHSPGPVGAVLRRTRPNAICIPNRTGHNQK